MRFRDVRLSTCKEYLFNKLESSNKYRCDCTETKVILLSMVCIFDEKTFVTMSLLYCYLWKIDPMIIQHTVDDHDQLWVFCVESVTSALPLKLPELYVRNIGYHCLKWNQCWLITAKTWQWMVNSVSQRVSFKIITMVKISALGGLKVIWTIEEMKSQWWKYLLSRESKVIWTKGEMDSHWVVLDRPTKSGYFRNIHETHFY